VAKARRQGAVLAVAKVTPGKEEAVSKPAVPPFLNEAPSFLEPGEAAFHSFVGKVERALSRAREQIAADPLRTLGDLRKLRHEVRRFPDAPAEGRDQLLDRITRFIEAEYGVPTATLDRTVNLADTDNPKVPVRFLWTRQGPVLVTQDTSRPAGRVEVCRRKEKTWELASTLERCSPPVFACATDDDVAIVAYAQKYSQADTYDRTTILPENTIQCVRFASGKATAATVFEPPADGSTSVIAVAAHGDMVSAFLIRSPGGAILYLRSTDGGRSWPYKPVQVADSMATDRVFAQSGFHLSGDHFGLFAYDDQGAPVLLRTVDNGKNWSKEPLSPSGCHGPACFPLACFPVDGELGLVYVARLAQDDNAAKGRFFFARSDPHTVLSSFPAGSTCVRPYCGPRRAIGSGGKLHTNRFVATFARTWGNAPIPTLWRT
jgi:hypothetical protein